MSEQTQSAGCSGDCGSCGNGNGCESKPKSLLAEPNKFSNIKKVIAVVSGKGGVGKSMVTSMLAVAMQRKGYKVAILDADITGPSIPRSFGMEERCLQSEMGIEPIESNNGIKVMSINLLMEDPTAPVLWRGPVIGGVVQQFWTDVHWGDVDYMFVDMPPGTGDVPLTVFQSLPVDGIVVISTPQDLVGMIVEKAVNMANAMNKKVLGLVENMSYFVCPECKTRHHIYGPSHADDIAEKHGIPFVVRLPMNPEVAAYVDRGEVEALTGEWFEELAAAVEEA